MNNLVFTVQTSENTKPLIYAKIVPTAYRNKQTLAEALIRDWIEDNDVPEATDEEIEDLAYTMRKDGYTWWDEVVCFELTDLAD